MRHLAGPSCLMIGLLLAEAALAQVVVPVRPIRSQTLIAAEDLSLEESTVPGALEDIAAAVGREARVTLYPGRPVLASQVGAPAVVERNGAVRMHYMQGPLSIATEGRAMDRAGVGEQVRVMNLTSKQIVTGTVAPDGSIKVGQP